MGYVSSNIRVTIKTKLNRGPDTPVKVFIVDEENGFTKLKRRYEDGTEHDIVDINHELFCGEQISETVYAEHIQISESDIEEFRPLDVDFTLLEMGDTSVFDHHNLYM